MKQKVLIFTVMLALLLSANLAFATYSEDTDTSVVSSITLKSSGNDLEWTVNGYSKSGFKVVWSKTANPTYPTREGDQYQYFSDPNKRSTELTAFAGSGTYYARVCEYLGGKCGTYSNQVTLTLGSDSSDDTDTVSGVKSIVLKGTGAEISWTVDGYSANGYKIVWSKNANPTYPNREGDKYHYYADPDQRTDKLSAFSGVGTYYVRVCEYKTGCGVYSNEIAVQLTDEKVCYEQYDPVCGVDGHTYTNICVLNNAGVAKSHYGLCVEDDDIKAIEDSASDLFSGKLDAILAELNRLRDLVQEQQVELNYLRRLVSGMGTITASMQQAINSFITYGVDDNTQKLGEGERAAVMFSFKEAFGKLPQDEEDLADAVKIANGRWPKEMSQEAEDRARELFYQVYLRDADMNNVHDAAAIKVMAYGLRQKAMNRNLNSERSALKIYKGIFGHVPQTTEDWNVLQAITYSGATR